MIETPIDAQAPHHAMLEQRRQETIARLEEIERQRAAREEQEREKKRAETGAAIAEIDRQRAEREEAERAAQAELRRKDAEATKAVMGSRHVDKPAPVVLSPAGSDLHADIPDVGVRTETVDGVPTQTLWYPAADLFSATVVVTATRPGSITIGNAADEPASVRTYEVNVTMSMVRCAETWLRQPGGWGDAR